MRAGTVESRCGETVARFVPEAGMVCCSLRHLGVELLDERDGVAAYRERGKTMGIPLLYPWANRLAAFDYGAGGRAVTLPADTTRIPTDPQGLPNHGVVPRLMRWKLEEQHCADALSATLSWREAELLELFPFVHEVRLEAFAERGRLTLTTTVLATGEARLPVSFGFHPFLRLPDVRRADWLVELPELRALEIDASRIPTGVRGPRLPARRLELADSSWDDGFEIVGERPRFTVWGGRWAVEVEFLEGFGYAQLYAPPTDDVICFEPMTAPANALRSGDGLVVLEPGAEYRAVFRVAIDADR